MSNLVNATRSYNAVTQNGAVTHSTSLDSCLDMFSIAGATRNISEEAIITMFERAWAQDKRITAKILFWARDARQGAGERRFFHVIMKHMLEKYPKDAEKLIVYAPEFGYWKDIFTICQPLPAILTFVALSLETDTESSLLAKWFPRKGVWFKEMHKYLQITPKELRKKLVSLTYVVETNMCNQDWSSIEYKKVPSLAMHRYRSAFQKQDPRYMEYIAKVNEGKEKINASVVYPYQLYQAIKQGQPEEAVEAQWNNMPDYMKDSTERILPVCDVSGSMSGQPLDISVSLGLYISERNRSIFKDAFITFSEHPTMQYLQGSLAQRIRQLEKADWDNNTNLQATFELILRSAIREKLNEDDMPTKILIISDMEFDEATPGNTNYEAIRMRYQQAGYKMPQVIFWNVNGRTGNSPVQKDDYGTGLVSGFSPSILKSVLKGEIGTPVQLMLDTVLTDRYECIEIE